MLAAPPKWSADQRAHALGKLDRHLRIPTRALVGGASLLTHVRARRRQASLGWPVAPIQAHGPDEPVPELHARVDHETLHIGTRAEDTGALHGRLQRAVGFNRLSPL